MIELILSLNLLVLAVWCWMMDYRIKKLEQKPEVYVLNQEPEDD